MSGTAILIRWLKTDGALVVVGNPICEIETEKAAADISAHQTGILRHLKHEGESVRVGEQVARIDPPDGV
jgi:2-oxoglutarate dehydrogenase E2 component (dihydrolipoamide succinyltransferase)